MPSPRPFQKVQDKLASAVDSRKTIMKDIHWERKKLSLFADEYSKINVSLYICKK